MKKLLLLFIAAFTIISCSVEETNEDRADLVDVTALSEERFINFMEEDALSNGLVPEAINPDASVYPYDIESIVAVSDLNKLLPITNPEFGNCVDQDGIDPATGESILNLKIAKVQDGILGGPISSNNTKFTYTLESTDGWFIYSVFMNIDEDCDDLPLTADGTPNVCRFNIRNCFGSRKTKVTYTFSDSCIDECTCNSVYAVLYRLNSNGGISESKGIWLDGDQVGDSVGTTNSFCKDDCGTGGISNDN
ncbi:hypothetical protein [Nonlabens xylanidelens]|nr:hypothetical protein [Nonlabens xylanidelens]PQJ20898.1 hypothetical protein BST94_05250 [Nonlabens xylanidelens]